MLRIRVAYALWSLCQQPKEKNGHPADKNPIVRNDNNKADAMPAANIDEEAILKAGFRSEA